MFARALAWLTDLNADAPLTKAQLGRLLMGAGALAALGIVLADVGRWLLGRLGLWTETAFLGFGPTQTLAALGALAVMGVGGALQWARTRPPLPAVPAPALPAWVTALGAGLVMLALLLLAYQLVVYLDYAQTLLRWPFDYDQGEGFELYDTWLYTQGRWPYQDSQVFPFYTSIYPPLFHWLTAPLVAVFGPQVWTGRLVNVTGTLVAASAIGWAVWRAGAAWWVAVCAGLAYLASNYTFAIGPLFRQHSLMVVWETLGIVSLAQLKPGGWARQPAFWLGCLFLLMAGYTKQLALASVLAGLAWLFLNAPRRAVLAGLGLSAVAGGLFLLINTLTGGWWFVSIIRANINAFSWQQTADFYLEWWLLHGVLAGVAGARALYEIAFGRWSAYALWFVFAVANGALSGKFGAGESYFVTAVAAGCLLSGVAFARVANWARAQPRTVTALTLVVIPALYAWQATLNFKTYTDGPYAPLAQALGITGARGFYDSQGYTQLGPRPTADDLAAGWQLVELARQAPGPVFSEEAMLMFHAGKPVVTNPFPQLVMYQANLFDPRQEMAMIEAQAFGLVIFRAQFYPPPVLDAIGAHYQPLTEITMNNFTYRVLAPRPRQPDH